MHITGERIILRAIEREDLELIREWFNNPEVSSGLGDIKWPTSQLQQQAHYERTLQDERTVRLMVTLKDGSPIGITGFWDVHWRDRRAEHAVIIGDVVHQGKKFGQEIIRTCATYAFEQMDFHRLDATILSDNEASLHAYQACGFVEEGRLREHALRNGKRVDRTILGLLREDFN